MKRTASRQPTPSTGARTGSSRHLSLVEVCEDLGISRSTFYDWRAKRKAPPCFKLPNGDLRIRRADYERWLSNLDGDAA
jgi:predicted DNA-binding transcriptional regulator AlpA